MPRSSRALWPIVVALTFTACGPPKVTEPERYVGSEPVIRLCRQPTETLDRKDSLPSRSRVEPLRVELDHQWRDALPAPFGTRVVRHVAPRAGSRLDVAYGVRRDDETAAPVTFTVSRLPGFVTARDLERDLQPEAEVLWQTTLEGDEDRGWRAFQQSWSAPPGRFTLIFEATVPEGTRTSALRAFWGHPRILQPPAEPPRSLILLSIDTLSAEHLSLYGYDRPTSPSLDGWAERHAAVFENTVAPSPWTLPSHRSLFTGVDAVRHGANHNTGSSASSLAAGLPFEGLARRLRRAGYVTLAETGGVYLHPRYGLDAGFEQYGSWPRPENVAQELPTILDRGRRLLSAYGDVPFFLFLHTYEVHDPYRCQGSRWSEVTDRKPPDPGTRVAIKASPNTRENGYRQMVSWVRRDGRGERPMDDADLARACYDAGISRMDEMVGRFLRELGQSDSGRRWTVVLTSDHGEAFHGPPRVGHAQLYDDVLMVPLLISAPEGRGAGRRIRRQVRLIDVAPTVLNLLGQPVPEHIDGRSLSPLLDGAEADVPPTAFSYAASSNWGVSLRYDNRWKSIVAVAPWSAARSDRDLFFDLLADPRELRSSMAMPEARRLSDLLKADFSTRTAGLWLKVQNRGSQTLSGDLRGAMVRPQGTKTVDMECGALRLEEIGQAALSASSGCAFHLLFEKIFGKRLKINAGFGDGPKRSLTVRVDRLAGEAKFVWEKGRWRRGVGPLAADESGFSLTWQGMDPSVETPEALADELRRQLESLGYR